MAIGRGGKFVKRYKQGKLNSGYLSDESDFYGDSTTEASLNAQVKSFDIAAWFRNAGRYPSLTSIANTASKVECLKMASVSPSNIYEGVPSARQLHETVNDFLARLPPATTWQIDEVPWIWIANPFREAMKKLDYEGDTDMTEGPSECDSDWAAFMRLGTSLLEELVILRNDLEKGNHIKGEIALAKQVSEGRDEVVRRLLEGAKNLRFTAGKWMLFIDPQEVNAVWATVARAVANNELGTAAKVAPDNGDGRARLICIYTKDFSDVKDVRRVLNKMKEIGLVETRGRPIYYKCDAYTLLNLGSGNKYDIKASLYSSKELFQKPNKKIDTFFYERKPNSGDWRSLEF